MGRPYEIALRREAIELYEKGEKRAAIVQKLSIGIATLNRWIKRNRNGNLEPKVKSYMGGGRKVKHQQVVDYAKEHPEAYLREIGEVFGIRAQTVLYILKKNGIALEGRKRGMRKRMKEHQESELISATE